MNLILEQFTDDHIALFKNWLNKDYILKWYENPIDWLTEVEGRFDTHRFITHFIATCDNKSIGFCQYYSCGNASEDWYGTIPMAGTYSIDYLIGEEKYLGKGYGKKIVELLCKTIFSLPGSERIIVQPEQNNTASCNVLLSNGFSYDTENNLYIKYRTN